MSHAHPPGKEDAYCDLDMRSLLQVELGHLQKSDLRRAPQPVNIRVVATGGTASHPYRLPEYGRDSSGHVGQSGELPLPGMKAGESQYSLSNMPMPKEVQRGRAVISENETHVLLAKHVLATGRPNATLKVPRVIWQTWKSDGFHRPDSLWVERPRAEAMLSWTQLNPTWEYRLLDDDDMEHYIMQNYDDEMLRVLQSMSQGAVKADFWRYLVMYRDGGAYFDSDTRCKPDAPLDEWIDGGASFVTGLQPWSGEFHQFALIAANGSCIFETVIRAIVQKVKLWQRNESASCSYHAMQELGWNETSKSYHVRYRDHSNSCVGICGFAGPSAMMRAVNECLADSKGRDSILGSLQFCPHSPYDDWPGFSGRVAFKDKGIHGSSWNPNMPALGPASFVFKSAENGHDYPTCGSMTLASSSST